MTDILNIMIKNLFTGYDRIILVLFIVTIVVCIATKMVLEHTRKILTTSRRNASKDKDEIHTTDLAKLEDKLQPEIEKINVRYTLLSNLIALFPLLGMLGTVTSLIGLATGMSDTSNSLEISMFFNALTSTAWGIFFSIIFKLVTASISSKVEMCNKEYEIIATRVTNLPGE